VLVALAVAVLASIKEKTDKKEKQSARAQQPTLYAFFGARKKKK
jgi:hypothetical protein